MKKQQKDIIQPNIKKIFPVLEKNVELHREPPNKWLIVLNNKRYNLNTDTAKSFLLCTGKNSIYDTMKKIGEKGDADDSIQQKNAYEFFISVEKLGEVKLKTKKEIKPRKIIITGSFNVYYPYLLSIELTSQCNLHCSHCYVNASSNQSSCIPTTSLVSVLTQLRHKGLRIVELTGGEPLLHPDFSTIFRFCTSTFDAVHLFTNGTLFTPKYLAHFRTSKQKEKIIVNMSLDGSTPEIHDAIRGVPGAFQKTLNGLRCLSEIGIRIRVSMTVFPQNLTDIENTLCLAKKYGATQFTFAPVIPIGRGGHAYRSFSDDEKRVLKKSVEDIKNKYSGFVEIVPSHVKDNTLRMNCGAGFDKYTLSPTGDIRPCLIGDASWFSIGNIFKEKPEIVFRSSLISFLAGLQSPHHKNKPCVDCQYRFYCSGCWIRAVDINLKKNMKCEWLIQSGLLPYLNA